MPKDKRPATPQLFSVEPESQKQETPAPSSPKDPDQFVDQFVDQFMYLLTAPYMFYPPWGDIWTYQDRKNDALMHRLARGQEIWDTKECTEYEAMIYLSSASLAAPMSRDWGQVYFYLFTRAMPEQAMAIGNEVTELDRSQQVDLTRLRQWIFTRQMEHMKAKRNAAGKEEPVPAPEVVEQPKMF